MVKVKICGLKDPDTVAFTAQAGADWIGFVLIENSPRHVDLLQMKALVDKCGGAEPVALIPPPTDDDLAKIIQTGVGIIQVHGAISPERVNDIASRFPVKIWVARGIDTVRDIAALSAYSAADHFVLDTPRPGTSTQLGGHGIAFDWDILGAAPSLPRHWILAGGLNPQNVTDAIHKTQADAVDVSSGVEISRGVKSVDKIKAFIKAAKSIDLN